MTALAVPLVVVGVGLTAFAYAVGVRRLLGLRLSPLRAMLGEIVALAVLCASTSNARSPGR